MDEASARGGREGSAGAGYYSRACVAPVGGVLTGVTVDSRTLHRAARLATNLPVQIIVRQPSRSAALLVPDHFESVPYPQELAGEVLHGNITNMSSNGVFVALDGAIPPLLGRLGLSFDLDDHGPVVATGLVLRRVSQSPHALSSTAQPVVTGVGVLFETIALDARQAIARLMRSPATEYRSLVVDDSDVMRGLITDALYGLKLANSIAITEARNGVEALKILSEEQFDIVITDLHMPELDGFKLVQQIRNNSAAASVPILIITTDINKETQERVMALGADAFLKKPVRKNQITEAVRDLLRDPTDGWLQSENVPDLPFEETTE